MASIVDICNMALGHIGARQQINSIAPPDGSVEAAYCARFYPPARVEALESFNWAFAKRRAALASPANVSDKWLYAYSLPSDCVKARRVLQLNYSTGTIFQDADTDPIWATYEQRFDERGSADFEIEGQVLFTNEPDAVLLYTVDVTDPTKFTPRFVSALSMYLAAYLCGPIIKGLDGAKAAAQWRQAAAAFLDKAAASEANASSERNDHIPQHIRARN